MNELPEQANPFELKDWAYSNPDLGNSPFSTGAVPETKTYVNDQGHKLTITFQNGQPLTPIPAGYVPQEQAATAFQPQQQEDDNPAHSLHNQADPVKDMSEWSIDELEGVLQQQNVFDTMARASGLMAGPAGLVAGLGIKAMSRASKNRAIEEIEDRLADDDYSADHGRLSELLTGLKEDRRDEDKNRSPLGEGLFGGLRDAFQDIFSGGRSREERQADRQAQKEARQGFTGLKDMFDGGGPGRSGKEAREEEKNK